MKKYIQHQVPALPVKDIKVSLEYYRDILGFDIGWIWKNSYASVFNGEIEIHFDKQDIISPQTIHFFVEDADKVFEFLKNQKVDIIKDVESTPWGMREFSIREINGHILRIGHGEKTTDQIGSFRKTLPDISS